MALNWNNRVLQTPALVLSFIAALSGSNRVQAQSCANISGNYSVVETAVVTSGGSCTVRITGTTRLVQSGCNVTLSDSGLSASGCPDVLNNTRDIQGIISGNTITFDQSFYWLLPSRVVPDSETSTAKGTINGNKITITGSGTIVLSGETAKWKATATLEKILDCPNISVQPNNRTVYTGGYVCLAVDAAHVQPLTYQWRRNNANIPGKTDPTLCLDNVSSTNAGDYTVVVCNFSCCVTSSVAKLTVNPLPSPAPPWVEDWESATFGMYVPTSNNPPCITAKRGGCWRPGDTVSNFQDCGPTQNRAEILVEGGRKLLKLSSGTNTGDCADNIWIAIYPGTSSSLPVALLPNTQISFFERGTMVDPQWNGAFPTVSPPAGDCVFLKVTDNRTNVVVYLFQRATNYVEHFLTNGLSPFGYREIFLDSDGGSFTNNLYDDIVPISGAAGPGTSIHSVEFSIKATGWATLDDLWIGSPYTPPQDLVKPSLMFVSPPNGTKITSSPITIRGTSKDNVQVSAVHIQLNGDNWHLASTTNGWTNWSDEVHLLPGNNRICAYSSDISGNVSATNCISLYYTLTAPLVVHMTGSGTVTPNLDGQFLEIGAVANMTAKPAAGFIFKDWTGSLMTTNPKLSFVMQSNLMFTANFISNPFTQVKGVYQGLFSPSSGATRQNLGFLSATTTDSGAFSGKLQVFAGKSYSLSGRFQVDGSWSNYVAAAGLPPLMVQLQLDFNRGDSLDGQVSDGMWSADLNAYRSVFNATYIAPQQGKYTVVIPGTADSTNTPEGEGFGIVTVSANGGVSFAGSLADGSKVTQAAILSRDGQWPLFASPKALNCLLHGWVDFVGRTSDDLHGVLTWIKAPSPAAKFYPEGFVVQTEAVGSRYVAPLKGTPVINVHTGQVWFANGNLGQSFTNHVILSSNNTIINLNSNKLALTITPATGLFKGTVNVPGIQKTFPFTGVLIQKQNSGFGFFLGTNQTGRVRFESQDGN
jgi:hypothetical protein